MENNDDSLENFRRFNRERLNRLFDKSGKSKKFEGNEEFLKNFFNPENQDNETPNFQDIIDMIINDMEKNSEGFKTDEWTSDDGSYYSVSYSFVPEVPEDSYEHFVNQSEQPSDEYVIGILEEKMARAVEVEDFESAASFRDTIKSLRKGQESKG